MATSALLCPRIAYPLSVDEQLQRLESVLEAYPDHRALPDVEVVLRAAGVPAALLVEDERARKLWVDALVTRPLGDLDEVRVVAAEVELLVLEVRRLTATLRRDDLGAAEHLATVDRLAKVRRRADELIAQL